MTLGCCVVSTKGAKRLLERSPMKCPCENVSRLETGDFSTMFHSALNDTSKGYFSIMFHFAYSDKI